MSAPVTRSGDRDGGSAYSGPDAVPQDQRLSWRTSQGEPAGPSRFDQQRENTMTSKPRKPKKRRQLTFAAVTGVIAGAAREITAWFLHALLDS